MNSKNLIATVALASLTMLPALPVEAQGFFDMHQTSNMGNINRKQREVRARIEFARSRGQLTAFEYNRLMREFNQIARIEDRSRTNGLNWYERSQLLSRLDNLNQQVTRQMHDRQTAGRPRIFW